VDLDMISYGLHGSFFFISSVLFGVDIASSVPRMNGGRYEPRKRKVAQARIDG
jgi:hypothetical protein